MVVKADKLGFVLLESRRKDGKAIVDKYVFFLQSFSKLEIEFLYKANEIHSPRLYSALYLCRYEKFPFIKKGEKVPLYIFKFNMSFISYKLSVPEICLTEIYNGNSYLGKIKPVKDMYENAQKLVWKRKETIIKTRIIRIRKENSNVLKDKN